ncbi:UpxY family transcription antiterminator [Mediterranea massiliensis]|uniref:UpxY family transcription antiterminator n=1 Tax=Mediterranea massiliensis TaxID=1841865 RepID=UPI00266B9BE3|nr:UpxY family transcription antiterminator [Mediterranea massiliensis]
MKSAVPPPQAAPAPRQWLVLYVKSCMERKTAQRLAAMGIESYVPVQTVTRRYSDRLKKMEQLVLPLVVFVHVTPSERRQALTLGAATRYLVLRGQHEPAVIPDEQLRQFRFMLDYSPEAVTFSSTPLAPGDPIRVIKGPLAGLEGELITLEGHHQVFIRLDLLGCAHVAIPVGFVEKRPSR